MLTALAEQAARALRNWDCEIVETHHRDKMDAPSGTALTVASAIAKARGIEFSTHAVHGRKGNVGARSPDEIGMHAIRAGDVIGEHTVFLCGDGERLELTHRAHRRDIFATGALRAATWLYTQQPGLYTMQDMVSDKA